METGNLISPSQAPSLPPRSLSAAFFPISVGGPLRRVAGWGFQRLLSRILPSVRLPFFAFHRCCAPATARVPRGRYHAALHLFRPGQRCVSLSGSQAQALRTNAASHLPAVRGMLLSIMLMPSPASNPALNPAPFSRWTLRDKAAQRRLALR